MFSRNIVNSPVSLYLTQVMNYGLVRPDKTIDHLLFVTTQIFQLTQVKEVYHRETVS